MGILNKEKIIEEAINIYKPAVDSALIRLQRYKTDIVDKLIVAKDSISESDEFTEAEKAEAVTDVNAVLSGIRDNMQTLYNYIGSNLS